MLIEIDDFDLFEAEETFQEFNLSYREVQPQDVLEDISDEELLDYMLSQKTAREVILNGCFDFDDSEKRLIIQNLLGHNHLATADDMIDDLKKLFQ